jgi:hypothetical protein
MVLADEVFYIHGSPTHLLSVYVANQRLLADRIFLAHAANLRLTFYFARWKFGGFLHSFYGTCQVTRASSTGRCNTIQCIDSTLLAWENHLFGCA